MKVAIEVGWSDKPGGARRVAFEGVRAMVELAPQHEYSVYANSRQANLPAAVRQVVLACPSGVPKLFWDQVAFSQVAVARQLERDRPDVVLFSHHVVPLRNRLPGVVMIHDMTPFTVPWSFHRAHAMYLRANIREAVKRTRLVLTVSESSKKDICTLLRLRRDRVVVAHLAASLPRPTQLPREDAGRASRRPYLLYVGAIHPRKNLDTLLRAFGILKGEHGIPHELRVVGAKRWMHGGTLEVARREGVADDTRMLGTVPDEELARLYADADVFVYPSFYEGFGLPVLEAMASGTPVVTSDVSSLPEVAGDAALLVDPYDERELAGAIRRILSDSPLASALRERGLARATTFDWRTHAGIVLQSLERAANAW